MSFEDLSNLIAIQKKDAIDKQEKERLALVDKNEAATQYYIRKLSCIKDDLTSEIKSAIAEDALIASMTIDEDIYDILSGYIATFPNGQPMINPFDDIKRQFANIGIAIKLSRFQWTYHTDYNIVATW